jgi:hypothetical protein
VTGRLEYLCGGACLLGAVASISGSRTSGRAFSNVPQRPHETPVYDLDGRSLSIRDRETGR